MSRFVFSLFIAFALLFSGAPAMADGPERLPGESSERVAVPMTVTKTASARRGGCSSGYTAKGVYQSLGGTRSSGVASIVSRFPFKLCGLHSYRVKKFSVTIDTNHCGNIYRTHANPDQIGNYNGATQTRYCQEDDNSDRMVWKPSSVLKINAQTATAEERCLYIGFHVDRRPRVQDDEDGYFYFCLPEHD